MTVTLLHYENPPRGGLFQLNQKKQIFPLKLSKIQAE